MKEKFEEVQKIANCWGCAFMTQISGDMTLYCSKFAEGDPKIFPPCEDITDCEIRNSQIVHQLKIHNTKLGLGFLLRPLEGEDEGDAEAMLVGATGILFRGKLSELLPAETFVVLHSVRIFDEQGKDHTDLILSKALSKAYEETPQTKLVFSGLLDEDKSSEQS